MAHKVEKKSGNGRTAGKPAAAPRDAAAEQDQKELATLHPENAGFIDGRVVVMRSYGYIEGMRMQLAMRPFLEDLYLARAKGGTPPTAEDVAEVIANHIVTVQWLIAQAITPVNEDSPQTFIDQVAENARWIASLDDTWGDTLMTLWWGTNSGFFTRRLRRLGIALAQEQAASAAAASASLKSTAP